MRRHAIVVAAGLAAMTIMAAGCGDANGNGDPTPGATTASPEASAAPGQVSACVAGNWRSTEVAGKAGGQAASAQLSGGSGIALTIAADGKATLDLSGMQPVSFAGEVAGAGFKGSFTYAGQADGTLRTGPAATPAPAATPTTSAAPTTAGTGQEAGTWEPVADINWDAVRLTVDLTEPVQTRALDNAPIGSYVGTIAEQTQGAIDIDPLLDDGTYQCDTQTLTLSAEGEDGIVWTLTRQ